jgi:PAS domain S-box-containing protein
MMNRSIHLLDLIEKEKLDLMLRDFTEVTGVASIITEVDGRPITKPHNFTSLCKNYCRSTQKGRRKCYESDSYGGRQTAMQKKCVIYQCLNAGLLDSGAPIIVEGYHLANVLCGQVVEKPIDTAVAVQRAHSIGITDIDGYLHEMRKIPIMSRERLRSIVNLMEMITQTVSELALKKYLSYKHSQRYLNKVINSVSECIISTNTDSIISMVNDAGCAMFGYEAEHLIGQSILTLLSGKPSQNRYQRQVGSRLNGNWRSELTAVTAGMQLFPVQMSLSEISSEGEENSGYVAVIRDITEEKQIARMKEDLIGMLTHDMANPILSIQKAIELLVDGTLGALSQNQIEVMNLVLGTSHQLLGMVTDFLDIYRNENGQFLLRKLSLDLNQMLRDGITQLKFFAQDKGIRICFDPASIPLVISGDRNRLMRTFINLLDNAIKFSPEGSEIMVTSRLIADAYDDQRKKAIDKPRAGRFPKGRKCVLTTVSDMGLGIPKENQNNIFDKFFTVKPKEFKGRTGLGLGLAFCKLVVEAHDGFIWAESPLRQDTIKKPHGCSFQFILPMDSAP